MDLLTYFKKILGEEEGQKAFDKIIADKENVLLVDNKKAPAYVDKKELDTANETIKQYKKDIAKRDNDLTDLQGKVKDNEDLTKEIETLKATNKKASEDYEAKLNQITFDTKFEKALGAYKPKNPKALRALLDMEKVKLDGDNFLGLEDQMKTLKESDPYLFGEESKGGTGNLGGGAGGGFGTDATSLGERLAKEKTEAAKVTEAQNKFFS